MFGKFAAKRVCLGSIDGELSIMNKMSTSRSGTSKTVKLVTVAVLTVPPVALVVPPLGPAVLVLPPVAPVPPVDIGASFVPASKT
jgi:hypothetical protein